MTRARPPAHRCPACGSSMDFTAREDTIEYKGATRTIPIEAWWCLACGEAILDGPALAASERAWNELKAEVDGLLQPREVAAIRQRLGLSQREAGDVIGGGPRAFQKYESGDVMVSQAMSNLLRLLDNDPRRLDELRAPAARRSLAVSDPSPRLSLHDAERRLCEEALARTGSIVEAAQLLGITRHALKRRIIKHGIQWPPAPLADAAGSPRSSMTA